MLIQNPTANKIRYKTGDAVGSITETNILDEIHNYEALNKFFVNEIGSEEVNAIQVGNDKIFNVPWKPSEHVQLGSQLTKREKICQLVDEYWCIFSRYYNDRKLRNTRHKIKR